MLESIDQVPMLARRARDLASAMDAFAKRTRSRDAEAARRAFELAVFARTLASTLWKIEPDALTLAVKRLTALEDEAALLVAVEPDTVRPPAKSSGTFVVEQRTASTNRLLGLRRVS